MEKRKRNWFFWVFSWSDFRKENWWGLGIEPGPTRTQSSQIGEKILMENKELCSFPFWTRLSLQHQHSFFEPIFSFSFFFFFFFVFVFFNAVSLISFFFLFCFGCSSSHVFLFSPVLGSWIFFCYFFF